MKTFKSTLFSLLLLSCCIFSPLAQAEEYPRFYEDKDLVFQWEYDLSRKEFIIIRGKVKLAIGSEVETSIRLLISGLDLNGKRLQTGAENLGEIGLYNTVDFEIKVPKVGKEKHILFTYRYDFYAAEGGFVTIDAWFEDSLDDPAFKPKMVKIPPEY